jgi:hypothetical protein
MDAYPFHLAPPHESVTDQRLLDALVPLLDGI